MQSAIVFHAVPATECLEMASNRKMSETIQMRSAGIGMPTAGNSLPGHPETQMAQ
jgi:hypothetical protein